MHPPPRGHTLTHALRLQLGPLGPWDLRLHWALSLTAPRPPVPNLNRRRSLRPSCPLTIPCPSSPHLSSISPCLIPRRPQLPSSLLLSLTLSGLPIPPAPQIWPAHPSCLLPQSVLPPTLICPSSPPVSVTTLLPPSSAWLCVPLLCPLAPSSSPF